MLLLLNLSLVLPANIMLHRLGADIETLVVLLHRKVGLGFAQISSDEVGISLDGFVAVGNRTGKSHELDESGGTIRKASRVFGGSFGPLGVCCYRTWPVCLLEFLIAEFSSFIGFFRTDIGFLLGDNLCFFGSAKFAEDLGRSVFSERPLVRIDCLR